MLKLNHISPARGSKRHGKRLGRGSGSGTGTTSGHGNNGANCRSGAKHKAYFEGGQTPLTRRLPKRGFSNSLFRNRYQIVNVGDIEKRENVTKEVDPQWMFENGLIHSREEPVKVLGGGDLAKAITVKASAFSGAARDKIEKAKGKIEVLNRG